VQDTDPAPATRQAQRLAPWIRLTLTPGVGRVTLRQLLDRFHTPDAVLGASHQQLASLVSPARARALCDAGSPAMDEALTRFTDWLARPGNHAITMGDPAYPNWLRQADDPPLLLYASGRIDLLERNAVGIVGSRNATMQGMATARAFAHALSAAGMTVVSGLALGIDTAAHEGGLQGEASTVAVLGTGADRIYPARNAALARQIAHEGCMVSEYPLGTPPERNNFPRRNRIISGLVRGVLVVEAAEKSGSLITAAYAADQGRHVFAIPGSIHSALSKGCHYLIREGGTLVESVHDILKEIGAPGWAPRLAMHGDGFAPAPDLDVPAPEPEHADLLDAIGFAPVDCDTIAAATSLGPGPLAAHLLALELAGQIERLPGGLFQRIKPKPAR